MKDSDVLAAATELIRDENSWTRGAWCTRRRPYDKATYKFTSAEDTDQFCAKGAVMAAMGLTTRVGDKWIDIWGEDPSSSTYLRLSVHSFYEWQTGQLTGAPVPDAQKQLRAQYDRICSHLETTLNELNPNAREEWKQAEIARWEKTYPLYKPPTDLQRADKLSLLSSYGPEIGLIPFNDDVADHARILEIFEKTTLSLQERGE